MAADNTKRTVRESAPYRWQTPTESLFFYGLRLDSEKVFKKFPAHDLLVDMQFSIGI